MPIIFSDTDDSVKIGISEMAFTKWPFLEN